MDRKIGSRGAALLIVMAMLAVLTAVGLYLYSASRLEWRIATAHRDNVNAQFLADAGLAMAQAILREDLERHPLVTSSDHAWKSYFNGAWWARKAWAYDRDENGNLIFPDHPENLPPGSNLPIELTRGVPKIHYADLLEMARAAQALDTTLSLDDALDDVLIPRRNPEYATQRLEDRDPYAAPLTLPTRFEYATDNDSAEFYWNKDYRFAVPERLDPAADWDPSTNPYLTDAETIHRWADVDLDGDGLRDSMWIPIPVDSIANEDGIDNDLDGLIDEGPGMGTDGFDNDGDGEIDEEDEQNPPDLLDNDGDGDIDEEGEVNIVPAAETAPFVYYGGNDGLDNDGDGEIDEPDEDTLFLSAPFYDQFGNDITDDFEYPDLAEIRVGEEMVQINWTAGTPAVDVLDNDHSRIINDARGYLYPAAEQREAQLTQQYRPVDVGYFDGLTYTFGGETYTDQELVLTFSGEPVAYITGRVAVLVTDESSKANLNASHGLTMRSAMDPELDAAGNIVGPQDWQNVMSRSLNEGLGVHELDLRVYQGLGGLDIPNLTNMRTLRLGYPTGQGYGVYSFEQDGSGNLVSSMLSGVETRGEIPEPENPGFRYDLSLPGYGFTDDNGDAFWAAFDGLDNDGDGFIDEGVQLVPVEAGLEAFYDTNENGWDDRSEALEGIDEPTEYRQFRPYRNRLAESDGVNNDSLDIDYNNDGTLSEEFYAQNTDELGEFGDQYYRTRAEIKRVKDVAGARYEALAPYVTVHSADRNDRYVVKERDAVSGLRYDVDRPELSGLRLDYNYAVADQIFTALVNDWAYDPIAFPDLTFDGAVNGDDGLARTLFARGLRSGADTFVANVADGGLGLLGMASTGDGLAGILGRDYLPADPELRAAQLAANVEDNRDLNHSRTEVRTSEQDAWWDEITGEDTNRRIEYTAAGAEDIRINEIMVRATRRVEAEALTTNAAGVEDLDLYPETIKATADWNQQFNPNLFSAGLEGRADFDYAKRGIPVERIVGADVTINDPRFGAGGEVGWWYGQPTGAAGGQPYGPSVGVLGRPTTADATPEPAYIGTGSYVGFQAPVPADYIDAPGTAPYSDYAVSATAVDVPAVDALNNATTATVPNLVQFRFGPSPQLPPGRYYLLANMSTTGNAQDTTLFKGDRWDPAAGGGAGAYTSEDDSEKMQYVIKYGQAGEDIVLDLTENATSGYFLDFLGDAGNVDVAERVDLASAGIVRSPMAGTRRAPDPRGVESDGIEIPTGMVLLPGLEEPLDDTSFPGGMDPDLIEAYGGGDAYYAGTVVIPPYAANPANQEYLYLAVWKDGGWVDANPTRPTDLGINYFEFSQEPDHEWVELVNTGAETVDVRGWTLEVGQFGDVNYEDDHIVFTIGKPESEETDETQRDAPIEIAPGGSLILAVNKFDVGADQWENDGAWPTDFGPVFRNGMGLCASDGSATDTVNTGSGVLQRRLLPLFGPGAIADGISIPPFPAVSPTTNTPVADSVFYRPAGFTLWPLIPAFWPDDSAMDFVDRNGNGIADNDAAELDWVQAGWNAENNKNSAAGPVGARSSLNSGYPPGYADAFRMPLVAPYPQDVSESDPRRSADRVDRPWDRVAQLYSDRVRYATGLEEGALLLDLILNGGVFPNTPDEDWIDNDHDAALLEDSRYYLNSLPVNERNAILQSGDNLDNNGNGIVDEKTGLWVGAGPTGEDIAVFNEGTDEGRFRREARRAGLSPPGLGYYTGMEAAVPGAGHEEIVPLNVGPSNVDNIEGGGVLAVGGTNYDFAYTRTDSRLDAYIGTLNDPPAWKDYVERRMYPGDCVFITLYEGSPGTGRIVDRVTYNQNDVENASFQDGIECPYTEGVGNTGNRATLYGNADLTTWPENTMAVDFYRTLERKHPLAAGDRHGTQNRWEATDGNYDDWHGGQGPLFLSGDPDSPTVIPWAQGGAPVVQYAHSVAGSPLRRNFFTRGVEALYEAEIIQADLGTPPDSFPPNVDDGRPAEVERDPTLLPYWHFQRDNVRNRTYSSPGEVVRMPHNTYVAAVAPIGTAPAAIERAHNVLVGRGEDLAEVRDGSGNVLGYRIDPEVDVDALVTTGTAASIVLTAGQADFYPIAPSPLAGGMDLYNLDDYEEAIIWDAENGNPPLGWTPIFLRNFNDGTPGEVLTQAYGPMKADVQLNFLLNAGVWRGDWNEEDPLDIKWQLPLGVFNSGDSVVELPYAVTEEGRDAYWQSLRDRWPLEKRAVMYMAANAASFEPTNWRDPAYRNTIDYPSNPPAEALFTWDGDDGVRNGPYDVYIITAARLDRLEELSQAAQDALLYRPDDDLGEADDLLSAKEILEAASRSDVANLGITAEIFTDRDGNRRVWEGNQWPTPASIDAAREDESFGMLAAVQPTPDGVVYYGQVEVENNYLGLFLRNWGRAGELNRFSRVILAAPRHTPGRININTVETKVAGGQLKEIVPDGSGEYREAAQNETGTEMMVEGRLVNPLAGMPGMLAYNVNPNLGTAFVPNDLDSFVSQQTRALYMNAFTDLAPPTERSTAFNEHGNGYDAALWRAEQLVTGVPRGMLPPWSAQDRFLGGRPWHVDGRYYRTIADVVVRGLDGGADLEFPDFEDYGRLVYDTARLIDDPDVPELTFGTEDVYDEKVYRFSRIANMVSTRSDTFEIIVRAQAGAVSGNDINGDGRVDYRNDFVPSQEKQIRTVYDR